MIPEGYKLVPIEPTPEMLKAAWRATVNATPDQRMACFTASPKQAHDHKTRLRWHAMISAAPQPNG